VTINIEEKSSVIILKIDGEVDLYNAPQIKDTVRKQIDQGKNAVLIDLGGVSYIDSSGIGALISSLSNLKKAGGILKICNIHGSVKKVFELTKLTGFFEIFEQREQALSSFN